MKLYTLTSLLILSLGVSCFASDIKADLQKESYAIGASTGNYVANQIIRQQDIGLKTDIDETIKGFTDALKGKLKLNDDEIITYLNLRVDNLNTLKKAKLASLKKQNLKRGQKYLAKNKTSKDVTQTKSGLQYKVLTKGEGKSVKPESVVVINYKAKLIDGTIFDDTYSRKSPAHLSMINVIEGLKEGLMLMKEGSKYLLTIPSKLAYKEDGLENIPPNSVVIFELELVKVIAPDEFQKMMHEKADIKIEGKDNQKNLKKPIKK